MSSIGPIVLLPAGLFLLAALGYVFAAGTQRRRLTWFTKPLVMPLLALTYALAAGRPSWWILVGLACGTVGDVFLIRPERRSFFLAGLASFLLGHLAYTVAFSLSALSGELTSPWVFAGVVPLAAVGVVVYRGLRPGLGSMKLPVAAYTAVVLLMALAALLRRFAVSGGGFWLPLFGALSFLVSDTLLAYQRFRGPLPVGAMLVALTYVGAQLLIVLGYLR
jgi:uncharacterized membrane protein YhhN